MNTSVQYHLYTPQQEGTLWTSTRGGRYALKVNGEIKGDLSAGTPLAIWLGGQWIVGRVEAGKMYHTQNGTVEPGYYFVSEGGICGLCVGMRVGLL